MEPRSRPRLAQGVSQGICCLARRCRWVARQPERGREGAAERKFEGFLEASAKKNLGCEELKQAILAAINWDEFPCRTAELLFKRVKDEFIRLKDEARLVMRFEELRQTRRLRLSREFKRFADEELCALPTLLASPGEA